MLHRIYQKAGITPDVFLEKPDWVQAFVFASEKVAVEMQKGGGENG